jgi:hypothetical protein
VESGSEASAVFARGNEEEEACCVCWGGCGDWAAGREDVRGGNWLVVVVGAGAVGEGRSSAGHVAPIPGEKGPLSVASGGGGVGAGIPGEKGPWRVAAGAAVDDWRGGMWYSCCGSDSCCRGSCCSVGFLTTICGGGASKLKGRSLRASP